MKKLLLFLSICLVAVSFNSCNDDDDNNSTDQIIGKWRVDQLLIKVDEQYEEDLLTECDKKSTIEFFKNNTYQLNAFELNEDESICVAQQTINGTWENFNDHSYNLPDFEIPGMTLSLEVNITFQNNKMILTLSGTMDFEGEQIDIMVKIIFIDNDDYKPDNIIGKWQLNQQFSDGTENILTECEKNMTIQFFEDGIYKEKDFYIEGLECIAVEVKNGNWKNLGNNMYEITDIDIPEVKVTFENNNTKMKIEFSETIDGIMHIEKLIFNKIT